MLLAMTTRMSLRGERGDEAISLRTRVGYPEHFNERSTDMDRAVLEKLRAEALTLTTEQRAELARDLIESLDAPRDAGAADEWDAEISRRLAEVDVGTAKLVDREELRRRIQQRMRDG